MRNRTLYLLVIAALFATDAFAETTTDPIMATVQVRHGGAVGSGTAIHSKLILTCAHVLTGERGAQPVVTKYWHDSTEWLAGEVLAVHRNLDLALIAVPTADFDYVSAVEGDPPTPQAATFCGHAGGRREILSFEGYISRGYSTNFDIVAGHDSIEGQSGGGVFDANGHLLGVMHGRPNAVPTSCGGGIFTPMRHIRAWIATSCQGPRCYQYLPPTLRGNPPSNRPAPQGHVTQPPYREERLRPLQPPGERADLAGIIDRLDELSRRLDSLATQPGPPGPPGDRGPIGPQGPPGRAAAIDEAALAERMEPLIDQRIEEAIARRVPHYFSITPRKPKGN